MAYLHGVSPWFYKKEKYHSVFASVLIWLKYFEQKKNENKENMKPSTLVLLKCQGREDMQIKLASSFWVQKTHNNLIILEIELDGHNTFGLIDRNNNKN